MPFVLFDQERIQQRAITLIRVIRAAIRSNSSNLARDWGRQLAQAGRILLLAKH